MKKTALTTISFLAAAMCLSAQEAETVETAPVWESNEVAVSYGIGTVPEVAYFLGAVLGTAVTFGQASADKYNIYGAATVGYFHWFSKMFALGAEGSGEAIRLTFKHANGTDANGNKIYVSDPGPYSTCITIMPAVKGRWLTKPDFRIYSKAALGGTAIIQGAYDSTDSNGTTEHHDAECAFLPMFQLTPLAFEGGRTNWKGFAELGFGAEGVVVFGLRYSF